MVTVRSLCVFCGSSLGDDGHAELARDVAQLLAETGIRLVYGGARVGLMGVLADACLAAGGEVTGVMPRGLFTREVGHTGLTELHEVDSMHERKQRMYDLADAFVALPGGFGTLEELAEVATWSQLGLLRKPIVLLDVDGFWDPLVTLLDRMVTSGLLTPVNRAVVQRARSPRAALDIARAVPPAPAEKWITPDQR
jgi:uncharacterized protein (TIGR00730 family)